MHAPVLLEETINFLNLKEGLVVVDATADGGGHAEAIIKRIMPGGRLIGIDQDEKTIEALKKRFEENKEVKFIADNFRNIDKILTGLGLRSINGALFDLGMSSLQLKESGRGFSFLKDEPLLMTFRARPSPEDLTAAKILNTWPRESIEKILREYGEERRWRKIAKAIMEERPLRTTFDLVRVIMRVKSRRYSRLHPATKTFQALRIAVNDELNALREGLEKIWNFLSLEGRVVVISFHSLEDRIVKNFFKEKAKENLAVILTLKPTIPSQKEKRENPSSRSAKLRVSQKI